MAVRTTATAVREILDTEQTDPEIVAYINIASPLVDQVAAASSTMTVDQLTELERWLTAHLIVITKERRGIEEEIGADTRIRYSDIFGPGLQATEYGQMVGILDPSGTLLALGKKKASIKAVTSFE